MQTQKTRFVPMLFSTEMVEAILNGTKTETRRIIKFPKDYDGKKVFDNGTLGIKYSSNDFEDCLKRLAPKININDIIWVRETFQITDFLHPSDENYGYIYKASENGKEWQNNSENWKWKPSLFMKKDACRIFLKCVSVHAEPLQSISEESAINEGVLFDVSLPVADFKIRTLYRDYRKETAGCADARSSYMTLWQKINGKESWKQNPFVWVYKFEKIEKPSDFI